ncbi:PDF receptor-like [Paramacrobiotus metropolitanus]|uniref:PDF receptor-like n=1 Tax=Paramacrobiotus metropolitanus TaxID=2943436 RepID=UPI00244641C3|nr:PDF receptor-like [Paramacrobiotus metropolitanus]XP_055331529.1 PDF receptor-like [Paramacrobiotus metropolitanus]XP_055331530.1 PDF receptor-like [Paramacrobiotus metropolitanus]XP_055331531.1 PDF receptor-like [Paramacrobiotus metropolitanus]XP_055331533.1 PDF receptor-like [Paramacrobiotus metropolitanus]XP_055331534.1 PDF receptor-like [Paramacrobiotus metropolitanus]
MEHSAASSSSSVLPPEPWLFGTQTACKAFLEKVNQYLGEAGWCKGTTDGFLCWPAAPPGETIVQLCPPVQGVNPLNYARKTCDWDGTWAGKNMEKGTEGAEGYTDYEPCIYEDVMRQIDEFYGNGTDGPARAAVLTQSRTIEIVGFPLSLICVIISLLIFRYFRTLRCSRTTIHMHLFIAIALMNLCKVIEISDQFQSGYVGKAVQGASIRKLRPLCEILVVLIEYGRTAMFFWMFLEGLYMHNVVAWKVFESSQPNFILYCATGWGIPALLTAIWAPIIEFVWLPDRISQRNGSYADNCWFDHNHSEFYYILEVPRLFVIAINLIFLVNIIRVLLTKLRDSRQSDTVQIRKAIKATIVLAPLLGITHLIWAIPPNKKQFELYATFLYVSHFLRAFEGFFVALVYCFMNGEVQAAIKTALRRHALQREALRGSGGTDRRISASASSPYLTRQTKVHLDSTILTPLTGSPTTNGTSRNSKLFPNRQKKPSADADTDSQDALDTGLLKPPNHAHPPNGQLRDGTGNWQDSKI